MLAQKTSSNRFADINLSVFVSIAYKRKCQDNQLLTYCVLVQ